MHLLNEGFKLVFHRVLAFVSALAVVLVRSGQVQFASRQQTVRVLIFFAGAGSYIVGQSRRRWLLVPADGFQIITHVLLVVRILSAPWLILLRRPEARGVRSQNFIPQHYPSGSIAKLKFGICDDDAALCRVAGGRLVNAQAQVPQLLA